MFLDLESTILKILILILGLLVWSAILIFRCDGFPLFSLGYAIFLFSLPGGLFQGP